jgi:hypothetical protein
VEEIHGLQTVAAPIFFPKSPKNKETWWKTKAQESMSTRTPRDEHSEDESGETEYVWDSSDEKEEGDTKKTTYIWDSMDEEDRTDTIEILKQTDGWVIWKTKDKWSVFLTTVAPTPLHHERHPRGMLGIKDQRMLVNRRHSGQKAKKDLKKIKCWVKD